MDIYNLIRIWKGLTNIYLIGGIIIAVSLVIIVLLEASHIVEFANEMHKGMEELNLLLQATDNLLTDMQKSIKNWNTLVNTTHQITKGQTNMSLNGSK